MNTKLKYFYFIFMSCMIIYFLDIKNIYSATTNLKLHEFNEQCIENILIDSPVSWFTSECEFDFNKEIEQLLLNKCKIGNNGKEYQYNNVIALCNNVKNKLINKTNSDYIEEFKKNYFYNFKKEDGYNSIGEAFDKFFDKPKWSINGEASIKFTGVAEVSGNKALITAIFPAARSFKHGNLDQILVGMPLVIINNRQITGKDLSDFLAAVML